MEQIIALVEWFKTNGAQLAHCLAYIIAAASIIVKLTPSKKDDKIMSKIVKFVGKYIALNPNP